MESISQDYYVYFYRYPKSMGGAIFYVGKGQKDRLDDHEREARGEIRTCNAQKVAIIREIWDAGEEVVKEKAAFFEKEADAYLYEWGLINMTTYSGNLTNIYRGKGYPHRLDLDEDKFQNHRGVCMKKQWAWGGREFIAICHKVSDIRAFCLSNSLHSKKMLAVINGDRARFEGYSVVDDCGCTHGTMTIERIELATKKRLEAVRCCFCREIISPYNVSVTNMQQCCCKDHRIAYQDKIKNDRSFAYDSRKLRYARHNENRDASAKRSRFINPDGGTSNIPRPLIAPKIPKPPKLPNPQGTPRDERTEMLRKVRERMDI